MELEFSSRANPSIRIRWSRAVEIFAPLQASEAARIHAGNFDRFEPAIRDRLMWGASLTASEIDVLRWRHTEFRTRMDELFTGSQLLLLPCAPVARLEAGADHSQTRARLLRYTAPFSLAGVRRRRHTLHAHGGVQLAAARDRDEALLKFAALIGAHRTAAAKP